MKNDNRVCRSGGIRRIFDNPPPRLLKIYSSDFFSSGAIIVFRFYAFFPPYALVKEQGRTSSSTSPSYSIICYPSNFRYKKDLFTKLFRDNYVNKIMIAIIKELPIVIK